MPPCAAVADIRYTAEALNDRQSGRGGSMFSEQRGLFGQDRPSYWQTIRALMGHLIGTTIIFVVVMVLAWLIEVIFYVLHSMHPFPNDVIHFVRSAELGVLWADSVLCILILGASLFRFCKDNIGGRQ